MLDFVYQFIDQVEDSSHFLYLYAVSLAAILSQLSCFIILWRYSRKMARMEKPKTIQDALKMVDPRQLKMLLKNAEKAEEVADELEELL